MSPWLWLHIPFYRTHLHHHHHHHHTHPTPWTLYNSLSSCSSYSGHLGHLGHTITPLYSSHSFVLLYLSTPSTCLLISHIPSNHLPHSLPYSLYFHSPIHLIHLHLTHLLHSLTPLSLTLPLNCPPISSTPSILPSHLSHSSVLLSILSSPSHSFPSLHLHNLAPSHLLIQPHSYHSLPLHSHQHHPSHRSHCSHYLNHPGCHCCFLHPHPHVAHPCHHRSISIHMLSFLYYHICTAMIIPSPLYHHPPSPSP